MNAPLFWSHVRKQDDGCWLWLRSRTRAGYGAVKVDGKHALAHRVAYMLVNGPLPSDMHLHHICGNRRCIRTDHLLPVTGREHRAIAANAAAVRREARTHCFNGHALDDANTSLAHAHGYEERRCRACKRDDAARLAARKREASHAG